MKLNQVSLPATDVERSAQFYRTLGFEQLVHNPPDYARFECPGGDATFSVHRVATVPEVSAGAVYFECDDLDAQYALLRSRGIAFDAAPVDQPWLWREAYLRDPDGNVLCLYDSGAERQPAEPAAARADEGDPGPLAAIQAIDYVILPVRDMTAMRAFYTDVMGFALNGDAAADWVEYLVGDNVLTLSAQREGTQPPGAAARADGGPPLQLAFRVSLELVDRCATALRDAGVTLAEEPRDQDWGIRTVYFNDPDGNLLEIFADLAPA